MMESRNNLHSKLKKEPTFQNVLCLSHFFPFCISCFFLCSGQVSYKFPNDPTPQHSLSCRPEFSHMALVARSVGMILVHLIFKTHRVGTDVFSGDCEMKFMNKGAWVMLEDNMVSGLCETNAC